MSLVPYYTYFSTISFGGSFLFKAKSSSDIMLKSAKGSSMKERNYIKNYYKLLIYYY